MSQMKMVKIVKNTRFGVGHVIFGLCLQGSGVK